MSTDKTVGRRSRRAAITTTTSWFRTLRTELDDLAATTWHKIEVGPTRGLTFGEESLTDHNLFELDRRCPGVEVYKFNHNEEVHNGADFEWYVGGQSAGWLGMRFQAKKLDDGHYLQLGHRTAGVRQYDLLLRNAHLDNMWPLYCFYNGWEGSWPHGVLNSTCPNKRSPFRLGVQGGCNHAKLEHFGCSLAPADFVAQRHRAEPRSGRLTLDDYLSVSRPWSNIFTHPTGPAITTTDSALHDLTETLTTWFTLTSGNWAAENRDVRLPNGGGRFDR